MYYLGIDVGGTQLKCGLVDSAGNILHSLQVATHRHREGEQILQDIGRLALNVMSEAGQSSNNIIGVGAGFPGTINSEQGIIVYSNNLSFENVPCARILERQIGLPVRIANDANCAALGEAKFGGGKGLQNVCLITLGTGVGSGIILDGKILEGAMGAGAEAGHICVVHGGARCSCGRKGCWEAYASATALIRQTRRKMRQCPLSAMHEAAAAEGKVSGRTAFKAARQGDEAAQQVVSAYTRYVAEGLIDLANIFRPDAIVMGGGVCNEGQYFIDELQRLVDESAYGGARNPRVAIVQARLKNNAGIIGAAALAMR